MSSNFFPSSLKALKLHSKRVKKMLTKLHSERVKRMLTKLHSERVTQIQYQVSGVKKYGKFTRNISHKNHDNSIINCRYLELRSFRVQFCQHLLHSSRVLFCQQFLHSFRVQFCQHLLHSFPVQFCQHLLHSFRVQFQRLKRGRKQARFACYWY